MMVIDRLIILGIFVLVAMFILNVIIPYMFPSIRYWWMFRKNSIDEAYREKTDVITDIAVTQVKDETAKLKKSIKRKPEKTDDNR